MLNDEQLKKFAELFEDKILPAVNDKNELYATGDKAKEYLDQYEATTKTAPIQEGFILSYQTEELK